MSLIRRIRPEKTGIRAPLGDLEMAVMQYIWPCTHAGCLAVQVQEALRPERPLALTTILTTLDRLYDKGILTRKRDGKAYRYHPALTEGQLQERIVSGVLGDLIAHFPRAVAAYFSQQSPPANSQAAANLAELAQQVVELQIALGQVPEGDAVEMLSDVPSPHPANQGREK